MTPTQHKMLAFITAYQDSHHGISPSFEEIRIGVGLASKSGVSRILRLLEKEGLIVYSHFCSRRIIVLEHALANIPLTALIDELAKRGYCARRLTA